MLLLIVPASDGYGLAFSIGARMFITGTFSTVYVYTPEVYPTTIRATGLGVASGISRIAGILTPFVANVLSQYEIYIPIVIYASVAFIAAFASMLLPIETKKRELMDTEGNSDITENAKKSETSPLMDDNVHRKT